jgi:hypothetical protein
MAVVLFAVLVAAALPAATAARATKPTIKTDEVGYFGASVVTNRIDIFVYSRFGPRTGTHVTVCVKGVCEKARGHNGRLAWYSASFKSRTLKMWDPVTFTAIASNSAGRTRRTVTKELLCIHNSGSTPTPDPAA